MDFFHTMAPKIVNKEEKARQILLAAIRVFAQNGLARTKMIDIAHAAGVGKGTIYEYFRTKDDVIASAYRFILEDMENMFAAVLAGDNTADIQLERLIMVFLEQFSSERSAELTVMMDFWAEGIRTRDANLAEIVDMKELYNQYHQRLVALLEKGVRENVFHVPYAAAHASLIMAVFDGIMLQWVLDPERLDMPAITRRAIAILRDAIRK